MSLRICHFTSVHPRFDTRILKMCKSLSHAGFEVFLVVADDKPDEIIENIRIISIKKNASNRLSRMLTTSSEVYKKALELNCDLYHFHDPELLYYGLKLKRRKYKVIYDSHEDTPRDILSKSYLWRPLRSMISFMIESVEKLIAPRLNFIITATPHIKERFLSLNRNTEVINNYPLSEEFANEVPWQERKNSVCFIGGINIERGIFEIIKALPVTGATLQLAGDFETDKLLNEVKSLDGWSKVNYHGHVDRNQARRILKECKAGLVTYHPHPNHIYAQPNKIFEYMSASIPVIASDFQLWKKMIDKDKFGIYVNPNDDREISDAINFLLNNPEEANRMGKNGRKAIEEKFNWEAEATKLIEIYKSI